MWLIARLTLIQKSNTRNWFHGNEIQNMHFSRKLQLHGYIREHASTTYTILSLKSKYNDDDVDINNSISD